MNKIDVSTPKHPNQFVLVDDEDFERLSRHRWHVFTAGRKLYARGYIPLKTGGRSRPVSMHVYLLGKKEGLEIDHRDRNGLNNQKGNLRFCTHAQNIHNQGLSRDNTSGYKGVYWSKGDRKWRAQIKFQGKGYRLGYFSCLIKAAKAYDKAARKFHGEFANTNFPLKTEKDT